MKDMQYYLQCKKRDGDSAMPKTVGLVWERVISVMNRSSPICSLHKSDKEMDPNKPNEPITNTEPPQTTTNVVVATTNDVVVGETVPAEEDKWSGTKVVDGVTNIRIEKL